MTYKIVRTHIMPAGNRYLQVIRLIFDPGTPPLTAQQESVALAYELLSHGPNTDAILIFSFSSPEAEAHQSFDLGRTLISRDGKGWIGDSRTLDGRTRDKPRTASFQPNVYSPIIFPSRPSGDSVAFGGAGGPSRDSVS